ncbi:MAG: ATP-grasp domain-containing protein [Prevotellaceae bacterium]|jgi:biotin carboxylase|nr:ATP-grasp domain-containing protein [Prevotellaceae bacterium]
MKKVLILNVSHNELRLIKALKTLNFYVIATGNRPDLIGKKHVDEHIIADYSDKDAILQIAKEREIDAVCACCNDFGVITAAFVAEKMGLNGHDTYENTLLLHHKDKFKLFAEKHKINVPKGKNFSNAEDAEKWAGTAKYPIIIKPIDLTGGKGITTVHSFFEAQGAIDNAFVVSKNKKIVIEQYIEGTQHAICTFLINKKVKAYCSNNEYSVINPYCVEIDTYPASNFNLLKDFLINTIETIADALELVDGIFHMQYRVDKDGVPYIIESMRRVLGNLYMLPAEKLTGINWDYWEARTQCGLDCFDFPSRINKKGFFAYRTIKATQNGKIKDIIYSDICKKFMFDQYLLWKPNDEITDYVKEQLGFLFFQFNSIEEMNDVMLNCYNDLYIIDYN